MAERYGRAAAAGRAGYAGAAVRHSRRRNTVNLYLTIGAAVLAAIGSLLSLNVFFNLAPTGLTVNGVTLYTPEQIQKIGGLVPGQNLVRLNTEYIENRLTENLVYIDDVSVLKNYPDGLIINVTEAVPCVQIEYDGGYCTMSESGRLLEIGEKERNKKLPLVTGFELKGYETEEKKEYRLDKEKNDPLNAPKRPEVKAGDIAVSDDDQKTAILTELLEKLRKLEFGGIAKIDLKSRADIKMVYDGRIQIELGSSVDLDIKLSDIKAVLDKELPENYEGTLRYISINRSVQAIPKKNDVPLAVGGSSGDGSSQTDDPQTDEYGNPIDGGYGYDNGYGTDGTWQSDDQYGYDYGYDQGYGYDYGYDQNYGYDYGYDQGTYDYGYDYGYDQNYGYDYGYDYGYGYGYDTGQTW